MEELDKSLKEQNKTLDERLTKMILAGRSLGGMPEKTAEQDKEEKLNAEVQAFLKRNGYA